MRKIILVLSTLALAGCSAPRDRVDCSKGCSLDGMAAQKGVVRLVPESQIGKLLNEELDKGVSKADIERCFKGGERNDLGAQVYVVQRTKSIDGRYCHLAFRQQNNSTKFGRTVTYTDGMTSDECNLKALYCLRPAAALKIARQTGATIDKSPIPAPWREKTGVE